ncbi:hypothetical protein [Demequina zhanjiangensis]|uniref:Holin-X, holin superfamily III n=1 Tax=Demequina zhanjiangensis TaxID=3051659 RepID=A0ABT8FZF9_9MICO|nr:hypothetical protein [Demequina sp. SYSU T00b26]MDN4472147.1 hypothetical protein [Demequina sp. SYSU T00b26]
MDLMSIRPGEGPPLDVRKSIYARAVEFGAVGAHAGSNVDGAALRAYERSVEAIANQQVRRWYFTQWITSFVFWVAFVALMIGVIVFADTGEAWAALPLLVVVPLFGAAVIWALKVRAPILRALRKRQPHPIHAVSQDCVLFGRALVGDEVAR